MRGMIPMWTRVDDQCWLSEQKHADLFVIWDHGGYRGIVVPGVRRPNLGDQPLTIRTSREAAIAGAEFLYSAYIVSLFVNGQIN